jgi:hypothetical protein
VPCVLVNVFAELVAPLVLMACSELQLPPGCILPPAAFFLVEQLLRREPSASTLHMAVQLLQGAASILAAADVQHHQQEQQQPPGPPLQQQPQHQEKESEEVDAAQQPPGNGATALDRQAGHAELQRLAYCSLVSSVAAAVQSQQIVTKQEVGVHCAEEVLELACLLLDTPSVRSSEQGCVSSGSSSSSSGSSCAGWSLAASLAAAAAAGAYTAHLASAESQGVAGGGAGSCADRSSQHNSGAGPCTAASSSTSSTSSTSPSVTLPAANNSSQSTPTAGATSAGASRDDAEGPAGSTGSSVAAMDGTAGAADQLAGRTVCPEGCAVCGSASKVLVTLWCLDQGRSVPVLPVAACQAAVLQAAQQRGITLHKHLQQQLQALAWRHPVPGVCGNVLCGRLEGPAAVGPLRGCRGVKCGGCGAAWYCSEGCQRAAWAVHKVVCGAST